MKTPLIHNMVKRIYRFFYFYIFANNFNSHGEIETIYKQEQPFGVIFYLKYDTNTNKFYILQTDINNEKFSYGSFHDNILKQNNKNKDEKKPVMFFSFKKEYNNSKQNVKVYFSLNSSTLTVKTKKNKEPLETHKTNNIYYILDDIFNKLNLRENSSPDYYKQENDIIFTKPGMEQLYKVYYAFHNKYRIYNSLTYINEQVNVNMGQVLNTFGVPAIYFHSGNGKEIFVYLGIHNCLQTKKVYYGILILGFDNLNICRYVTYMINKCPHCHSNIENNNKDKLIVTEDNLNFFKIDNNDIK